MNQSHGQQVSGASGAAKVRSVYRREIESCNLVIPCHWLSLQEVLGEGENVKLWLYLGTLIACKGHH